MTLLSVVVPAFNEANYLPRSLGSLYHSGLCLRHSMPGASVEVIVVDNGSTDETASLARAYGALVVSEPSRGVARARNAGARAAAGEFLVFVDADYRVPHDLLSTFVDLFQAEARLSAAGVKVRLEPTEVGPLVRHIAELGLWGIRRFKRMSFGVFAVRSRYFEQIGGFDETLYAYEDVEFLERIAMDARAGLARYEIVEKVTVHASARGLYRGGLVPTYTLMAFSRSARRDRSRCGYWYDR